MTLVIFGCAKLPLRRVELLMELHLRALAVYLCYMPPDTNNNTPRLIMYEHDAYT